MSTVHDQFVGLAEETIYGTGVAVDRFVEFATEGVTGKYERIESEMIRAGSQTLRADRFAVNPKGAEGNLNVEVLDGSVGFLFTHMLGAVASGTPTGGFTTHTFTQGDLAGKSLTLQSGRVDANGTLFPFTYEGGKVKSWELGAKVDEVVKLSLDLDFAKETIGTGAGPYALATPLYVAGTQLLTFVGADLTIAGTSVGVSEVSFKGDNGLKLDRYLMRGVDSTTKKEPKLEGLREYTAEITCEFDTLAQSNRVAAATAAGALAIVVATFASPQGGQLTVTLPAFRLDEAPANSDGFKMVEQKIAGKGLTDTGSPITIAYKTKDATP